MLRLPTPQSLGPGDRTLTINAVIYKEVLSPGGPHQVDLMRLAIRKGARLPLISRAGGFYGFFLIQSLTAEKTHVLPNGTFQKMEIELQLIRSPSNISLTGIQLF